MGRVVAVLVCVSLVLASCVSRVERKVSASVHDVAESAELLKVHMRSGELYVLHDWTIEGDGVAVVGEGEAWSADRSVRRVLPGPVRLAAREIAVFETDTRKPSGGNAAMVGMGLVSVVITFLIVEAIGGFVDALLGGS